MSNAAYGPLKRALDDAAVFDTHDHLRPPAYFEQPMTVAGLFRNTYLAKATRTADGSPAGMSPRLVPEGETDSWEATRAIVDRVKLTSYYRWLLRGLIELYDLPGTELTAESWEILAAELPRRYRDPGWSAAVLDRARIKAVIWDPFWEPGTWTGHDPRLMPSLRISSSLVAFHPDSNDYGGSNVIRDWAEHFDVDIASLADLELLIDRLIARNIGAGCRSLKSPIAYDRTLATGPGPRRMASRTFGTKPAAVSPAKRRAFGDYIIRFYLDRAREHGLVFQVHTGLARLTGSNPLLLLNLLEEYPGVVFDIFHGGYPWVHEVGALAQNYPNVRLNLTWLPQLSTEAAVLALKEWLQVVPQSDRITWGADCWTVEEMYGALLGAKHVIARALSELVEDDYIGLDDAVSAASSILERGGSSIYGTLGDELTP
jgi:hypothetical protein